MSPFSLDNLSPLTSKLGKKTTVEGGESPKCKLNEEEGQIPSSSGGTRG